MNLKNLKTDEIVSTLKDLEEERERKEDADDLERALMKGSRPKLGNLIERGEWKKVFNKGEYQGLSNYHD